MPRYVITEVTEATLTADNEAEALQAWTDLGAEGTTVIVVSRTVTLED